MSLWLIRTRRGSGNFLKTIISNILTFPSILCHSTITSNDCVNKGIGTFGFRHLSSWNSTSTSFIGARCYQSMEALEEADNESIAYEEENKVNVTHILFFI